jgi:hypothetical protein
LVPVSAGAKGNRVDEGGDIYFYAPMLAIVFLFM